MGRWPQHKAYFWEYAPFFRVLFPFAAGIWCYGAGILPALPLLSLLAALAALTVLYALAALLAKQKNAGLAAFVLLQAIAVSSGYTLAMVCDARSGSQWLGQTIDKDAAYLARITETPAEKEQSWKLKIETISAINKGSVTRVSGTAFVYLHKGILPMMLQKGDTIMLPGNWQPIANAGNPGEFDYATYCRRNNIYYQQYCNINEARLYAAVIPAAAPITERAHDWCMAQLNEYLPNPKARGLLQAMLLGDEVNLDEGLRQSFSDTGIVHVIAISGGNIMLFFFVIAFLLRWLRHYKYLWLKYAIALPLVWFYVVMAGSSPSAIRAAIMFSILAWGLAFQKGNNILNQLLATAFLLLCAQPMWLYAIGFQLSFIAVLSLALFYSPIHALWHPKNWFAKQLWAIFCASLAAELLVAPVAIYYFHNFPVLFLIANVAAYLFMGAVLILGIAIVAVGWWPALAKIMGSVATGLVLAFDSLIKWMQGFNPASFHYLKLTLPQLAALGVAMAGIAYFIFRKKKLALFTGLGALCAFLALLGFGKWASLRQQHFVLYNIAKGNHMEYITNGEYHVIGTDTLGPQKVAYAVTPSHILWQAWQKGSDITNELLRINNQTILILNKEMATSAHYPTDYLIVNYTGTINPRQLSATYTPKLIVIGNNYTRKQQAEWADSAAAAHVAIHTVSRDRAFVAGE